MSDRIAVFNDGRIEQMGRRRRSTSARRASSSRASWASRTSIERGRSAALHRPAREDPRASPDGEQPRDGTRVEEGIRDVVYLGPVTRYTSSLDGAASLRCSSRTWRRPRGGARTGGAPRARLPGAASTSRRSSDGRESPDDERKKRTRPAWPVVIAARGGAGRSSRQAAVATTRARRRPRAASAPRSRDPGDAKAEGEVNLIIWAGYVEDGLDRSERRLGRTSRRRPAARSTSRSATPPTRW